MRDSLYSPPDLNHIALTGFFQHNPHFSLLTFSFHDPQALEQLQWPEGTDNAEKEEMIEQLKVLQRLIRLTQDPSAAERLYERGLHSALQIASWSKKRFISTYTESAFGHAR